jgi:large conductance mechanosensitive channel
LRDGHEVIVADPNFAPMYATRTRKVKTDRRDAPDKVRHAVAGSLFPAGSDMTSPEMPRSVRRVANMLQGFRNFIARGNAIDLAVGMIIGAAFGAIVDSLVKDIITPLIGLVGGQPDFSAIKPVGIGIGSFLNNVISFLLKVAALYYFIVLPFNRFAVRLAPQPPAPTPSEALLVEIRDILKKQSR